jgi:hypothetical protein
MADSNSPDIHPPEYYVKFADGKSKVYDAYYNAVRSKASGKTVNVSLNSDLGKALHNSWTCLKGVRDLGKSDIANDPALACAEHFAFARWITFKEPFVGMLLDVYGIPGYQAIKKGFAAIGQQQSIQLGGGAVTPSTPRQERWGKLGVKAGQELVKSFLPLQA